MFRRGALRSLAPIESNPEAPFVDTLPRKRAIACDEKIDFFCLEPEVPVEVWLPLLDLGGAVLATETKLVPGGEGAVFEVPYESWWQREAGLRVGRAIPLRRMPNVALVVAHKPASEVSE
jgi:hypothetical protein